MKKLFFLLIIFSMNCFANEENEFYESMDTSYSFFMEVYSREPLFSEEIIEYDSEDITDDEICKILQERKDPKEIKGIIIKGSYLTDIGVSSIANYCPNLEILMLHGDHITDDGVEKLSKGCPKLRMLSLSAVNEGTISDKAFTSLANNYLEFELLILTNHNITKLGLETFEKKVECYCSSFTYSSGFIYYEDEQTLEFYGLDCDYTDEEFIDILSTRENLSLIKEISIEFQPKLSEKVMFYIAEHCPNLTHLQVWNNILTDEALISISENCPNLSIFCANLSNSKVTKKGLISLFEGCSNITSLVLVLSNSNITDEDISDLAKRLSSLQNISIIGYISIYDECKIHDYEMENEFNKQTFDTLEKYIGNVPSAPSILKDSSIFALAKNCPNLEVVEFDYNPEITYLSILELLKSCPNLKEVYVYGTSLTKEEVDKIVELYPNIDIEYGIFPNKMQRILNL